MRSFLRRWKKCVALSVLMLAGTAAAFAQRPPRPPVNYWLHVRLEPVSPALNEQLQLNGEGVVLEQIGPDGPAAKAGLKPHDIVLAVGDKPVKEPADLADAVDKSEGKELSLKVLRGGKPQTITVTPTKPPEGGDRPRAEIREDYMREVRDLERKIRERLHEAGMDMRIQLFQPGRFFPPGAVNIHHDGPGEELPDDMSVTVRKQGKNPAEIEVKQGEQTWTVKEDKLEDLPDNVRRPVESLLGRGAARMRIVGPPLPPPPRGPHPDDDDEHGPPHARRPHGPPGPMPPEFDGAGPPPPQRRPGPPRDDDGPRAEDGPGPGRPHADGPPRSDRRDPPPPRRSGGPPRPGDDGPDGPEGRRPDGPPRRPGGPPRPDGPDGPGLDGPHGRGPGGPPRRPEDGPRDQRPRGGVERRLNELSDRLNEMREQLDALRQRLRDGEKDDRDEADEEF